MGPIAVPAVNLHKTLCVETYVNGDKRQDGTTDDLIFSIPNLVKTLSEGTTLQPGDVLATGTPAGVGFGQNPPTFLKPGDIVEISVTGLGKLRNRVADPKSSNYTVDQVSKATNIHTYNLDRSCSGAGLTRVGSKLFNIEQLGTGSDSLIFVHGLGGNTEYFRPFIDAAGLEKSHKCLLYDLEGHGLSPTKADSVVTINSYAQDLSAIYSHSSFNTKSSVLIVHSMGCPSRHYIRTQKPSLV